MNSVLGLDFSPWKCYKCKKKYKGVYKFCPYWSSTKMNYSLMKRTCYKCSYVRPISIHPIRVWQTTPFLLPDYSYMFRSYPYDVQQTQYSFLGNCYDPNNPYQLFSGPDFRAIIPRNSFLGNCYEHGFF